MPFVIGFPRHRFFLGLQKSIKIRGKGFLSLEKFGTPFDDLFRVDAGLVVPQHDVSWVQDSVAKMPRVHALHLAVNVAHREGLPLVEAGEPEAQGRAALGEACIVVDMDAMACGLAIAVDLKDALVEISLLHLGGPVSRGTFPALANVETTVAGLLAIKGVFKKQRPFGL